MVCFMLMDHGFDATTSALGIGLIGVVAIPSTNGAGPAGRPCPGQALAAIYCVRGFSFFSLLLAGSTLEPLRHLGHRRHCLGRQHRAVLSHPG